MEEDALMEWVEEGEKEREREREGDLYRSHVTLSLFSISNL